MKIMMIAKSPHQEFNAAVRDGSVGRKLKTILEETRPESIYFTEIGGKRTAVMVVDLEDESKIPSLAEPWFLSFNSDVEFHPVMSPEDVAKAGLEELGKKWG
jgi:hypothetical protein